MGRVHRTYETDWLGHQVPSGHVVVPSQPRRSPTHGHKAARPGGRRATRQHGVVRPCDAGALHVVKTCRLSAGAA
ncbi:hypothetical protein GUJ93_ZPchr0007g4113 [Zizania palustris]|uniref:Uncharacterized protein n=1 Tax=Zizania palustris TaxID=103762 RepID=A0A8J5W5N2_ZIZPA|nr:hypothetical protein GUJ93_ZPchr0007g4113 [Zizania palustris]